MCACVYTHTHTHTHTRARARAHWHAHTSLRSSTHTIINKILMISNNNTNLNLSYHPPNPCLLLLPRSLILSPLPFPLSLSICIHLHSTATHAQISSDSTGRPVQTRFSAAIWIETVLVHFLEWPAENSREMVPWNWKNVVQMIWDFALEFWAAFHQKIGESETVSKCREMKKDKDVKTLQNGSKQELQSCTNSGIFW